ncbi:MAG: ATP-binding protein, partial [Gemmatimonadota bacterium]
VNGELNQLLDNVEVSRVFERTDALEILDRLTRLSTFSELWHRGHQEVFDSLGKMEAFDLSVPPDYVLDAVEQEQAQHAELQTMTLQLDSVIQQEVASGRREVARYREWQTWGAVGLLLVGLVATFIMAVIGWMMRTLTVEAHQRRRDAVNARREYEALLGATGDGVLGFDLEGRCTTLNRAGVELLGYRERELVGKDFHDTLHHTRPDGEPCRKRDCPIMQTLAVGGEARSAADEVLWRKDGSPLAVQWSLRPLVDGLELRGGVLTFTDMTEIRQKEEALQRAVRVREEVVSVVSHDLRNPLGVVKGSAELLLDLPLRDEEKKKQARIIQRSAQRMSGLIEDLLDVSRIEAGALVVRSAAESPAEILEEIREIFAPQAAEKGIRLLMDVRPDASRVLADRDRVLQALSNLMENALKFTPTGGRVILSARSLDGERVELAVSDNGPGLDLPAMEHLFDRFWQASRHDRTGSGLGLAIVSGIAEAHGGTVDVESRPGEGASFRLILPVAGEGDEAEARP